MTLSTLGPIFSSVAIHGMILAAIWYYGRANVVVAPFAREVVVPIAMELTSSEVSDISASESEKANPIISEEEPIPVNDEGLACADEPIAEEHDEQPETPSQSASKGETSATILSTPIEPMLQVTPTYPRRARRKGIEGVVVVRIRVSGEGRVLGAEIASSSGSDALDDAAKSAALGTKFRPGTQGGLPVDGEIDLTFDFRLK